MKNLIIAGGVGSRLWSLSRECMPKQFLKLFSGKSLFQKIIERNRDFVDEFIIVLNEEYYFLGLDQLEEVEVKNYRFIIESFGKNTAPVIAFGSLEVDDILFVTPVDHLLRHQQTNFILSCRIFHRLMLKKVSHFLRITL